VLTHTVSCVLIVQRYQPIAVQLHSRANSLTQASILPVQGMTLNCILIFIVTGSFLYRCVMRPASQRFFIHSCIYQRILIMSYLATFLGTNSLSALMCRKAVNHPLNQSTEVSKMITSFGWGLKSWYRHGVTSNVQGCRAAPSHSETAYVILPVVCQM